MKQIGIRELRQNASEYVRRAEAGETIEVTDRGRPVAVLGPRPELTGFDLLVAQGRVRRATGHPSELPPPLPAVPGARPLSEIIIERRADERY
jgi:prevent-host-death family protein